MIRTVAKLRAPLFGGKASVLFAKNFRRIRPADRMSIISQCMKQLREEYDLAESHRRIEAVHEDARNAEAVTLHAEPSTATH